MRYMGNLKDNELVEDINVVIDYVQNKWARTRGQKIGIVGYCVGGRITYLGATSCPGLSAASVYYGGRILVPFGDGPAPIDLTDRIKIPVMGNFGDQDENPTPDDVAQIDAKLTSAGVTHDFKMYPGAGHGFNCDDRGSYHEASAKDALERAESCGGHFREESVELDGPQKGEAKRNDKDYAFVAAWEYKGDPSEAVVHREYLEFKDIELKQRSYK